MRPLLRYGFLSLALLFGSAALAGEALDFELPILDGTRFFRLSEAQGKTLLINFWDTECSPCIREIPLLEHTAKARDDVIVIGITLSAKQQAKSFLTERDIHYLQLLAPPEPRGLLRRFGDPVGALPHTVVLKSDRSLCTTRTGEVDRRWIEETLLRCR